MPARDGDRISLVSPIVWRERPELARLLDADGRGRRQQIVLFEAEIGWVRECHAATWLTHGGQDLKQCCGYLDVWRWGTSIEEAISSARATCGHYGVSAESTLVVEVRAWVEEMPVLAGAEDPSRRCLFGRTSYAPVPEDWMIHDPERIAACLEADAAGRCRPDGGLPFLRTLRKGEIGREVVWSSTRPEEENAAAVAAFMTRWKP